MTLRLRKLSSKRAHSRAFLVCIFTLYGCTSITNEPYYFTRFAMDTSIEYTIMAPKRKLAKNAMLKAHQEIERIEHLFWEKDSTSEIYRFNQSKRGIETTEEVFRLVRQALEYNETTRGAFDITLKPLLDLYPFLSDNPVPPTKEMLDSALKYVGEQFVETSIRIADSSWILRKSIEQASLAIGGFVKGYAVDRAIEVLKNNHIRNALINAGGDLYCLGTKGSKPWKVGIQNPRETEKLINVLSLSNIAVATSGDYQRFFLFNGNQYHHILDPGTGIPARRTQSATVIAPTAEEADVWATAVFVLGHEEGIRLIDNRTDIFGSAIDSSGLIYYSKGFGRFLIE